MDTELYASYQELEKAGYTKNDWEFLAGPTYVQVPMYSTQQEDSIVDAALLAVDLLNQKAEDFAVELKVYKQNNAKNAGLVLHEPHTASSATGRSRTAKKENQLALGHRPRPERGELGGRRKQFHLRPCAGSFFGFCCHGCRCCGRCERSRA